VENLCASVSRRRERGAGPCVRARARRACAQANVKKLRELLRPDIDIVGVGGVSTGMDAFELLLCGACAVQVSEAPTKQTHSNHSRHHSAATRGHAAPTQMPLFQQRGEGVEITKAPRTG